MNLYLVQHAEPKRKEEDSDRPLAEKGWTDIRRVTVFISERSDVKVDRILHSGKTRARQTAEALTEYLKPQGGVEVVEDLDPMADPAIWADKFVEISEDVMLVGHLPHLSRLASRLICGDEEVKVIDFQMGGVVCLGRNEEGIWAVRWVIVPGMVR